MCQYFCNYLLDLLPLEQTQAILNKKSTQTTQGQKSKGRNNTTLKPEKRRPQVEQVRKRKKKGQRNTAQMKEQGRN